jgi:3-methylfumaryl-CoA hydratase
VSEAQPFAEWIGRTSRGEDLITDRLVESFHASLEPHLFGVAAGEAPPGLHWCLAPPIARTAELGPDGHPAKNRDLPPVPQPRRMWAGGSVETLGALRLGDPVVRTSTIAEVTLKQGRSGELWFVGIDHQYATPRGVAIRERQDLVYRGAAAPPSPASGGGAGGPGEARGVSRSWAVETTPTLLFRYSALTFNGHRIHYDVPYATEVEGYGGLVVHGPLQATLLLNLAAVARGGVPAKFTYRGVSPAIAGEPLTACADPEGTRLWTEGASGRLHMEANAT